MVPSPGSKDTTVEDRSAHRPTTMTWVTATMALSCDRWPRTAGGRDYPQINWRLTKQLTIRRPHQRYRMDACGDQRKKRLRFLAYHDFFPWSKDITDAKHRHGGPFQTKKPNPEWRHPTDQRHQITNYAETQWISELICLKKSLMKKYHNRNNWTVRLKNYLTCMI